LSVITYKIAVRRGTPLKQGHI